MSWFRLRAEKPVEKSVDATTELFSTAGKYGLEILSDAANAHVEFVIREAPSVSYEQTNNGSTEVSFSSTASPAIAKTHGPISKARFSGPKTYYQKMSRMRES